MLRVSPGREDDFERVRGWLGASAALDAVIEATEEPARAKARLVRPLPRALVAAYRAGRRPERTSGRWLTARART